MQKDDYNKYMRDKVARTFYSKQSQKYQLYIKIIVRKVSY